MPDTWPASLFVTEIPRKSRLPLWIFRLNWQFCLWAAGTAVRQSAHLFPDTGSGAQQLPNPEQIAPGQASHRRSTF